ncbi:1-phosphatidylinositol 3-phosphate 5-kinase fab1 [Phytophthora cinnamomi]|uniref:1-phosphatidylinositol 3-phosphate 5-kinase fab1 n=1 Tax=Phytophthora cinnamomi TaxID=4785 RepID=UPI00355ABFDF|nr:1-phosphatidylinositol 3-phosphate 5-kinase fab1 [Phytophthora cinnamomi]
MDALYLSERAEVDELVRSASDMSVWAVENRKDNAMVFLHSKNSERLSYSVRLPEAAAPRNFLDGEVLHAHHMDPASSHDGTSVESMTLKWLVYSSPKTLGRSKEFCIREYCALVPNHPVHGNVGVLKFESYDGAAAQYGIRGKPDAYSLTVFEPSSFVVQQTPRTPTWSTSRGRSRCGKRAEARASQLACASRRFDWLVISPACRRQCNRRFLPRQRWRNVRSG